MSVTPKAKKLRCFGECVCCNRRVEIVYPSLDNMQNGLGLFAPMLRAGRRRPENEIPGALRNDAVWPGIVILMPDEPAVT